MFCFRKGQSHKWWFTTNLNHSLQKAEFTPRARDPCKGSRPLLGPFCGQTDRQTAASFPSAVRRSSSLSSGLLLQLSRPTAPAPGAEQSQATKHPWWQWHRAAVPSKLYLSRGKGCGPRYLVVKPHRQQLTGELCSVMLTSDETTPKCAEDTALLQPAANPCYLRVSSSPSCFCFHISRAGPTRRALLN